MLDSEQLLNFSGIIEEDPQSADSPVARCPAVVVFRDHELVLYNDGATDRHSSGGAFVDLLAAIAAARRFVFVVDWSFHPLFIPVRKASPSAEDSIGAVLIRKAKDVPDITIAVHTWDHTNIAGKDAPNDDGDEYLKAIARQLGLTTVPENLRWRASSRKGFGWSHHQKFVVCDGPPSAGSSGKSAIKAFFGGLDITKGRFDWPSHPLWPQGAEVEGLQTTWSAGSRQANEWYNPEFSDDHAMPRQPWHDIHGAIAGPAAWAFVREFVGRWNRSPASFVRTQGDSDITSTNAVWTVYQALRRDSSILQVDEPCHFGPWNAEFCRSLTRKHWGASWTRTVPSEHSSEFDWHLEAQYERSILDAYLRAIASAQEFIYIENQFLIGSGAEWQRKAVQNTVPQAIVRRILRAAGAFANFHVYIVLPMFPEGKPDSGASSTCRNFQWQTISWMIRTLAASLPDTMSWERYISFYFLANWKKVEGKLPTHWEVDRGLKAALGVLKENRHESQKAMARVSIAKLGKIDRRERVRHHERYMIYVHSKFMIADDRTVILGSANLNERSLAGDRDAEVACLLAPDPSQGDSIQQCTEVVRAFRKRLWEEHFSVLPAQWTSPGSAACVEAARRAGGENYIMFRTMRADPTGHICHWPFWIHNGALTLAGGREDEYPESEMLIPDAGEDDTDWQWNSPGTWLLRQTDVCE